MEELDAANWMIFGNRSFRLDQRNIITAALQVYSLCQSFIRIPTCEREGTWSNAFKGFQKPLLQGLC